MKASEFIKLIYQNKQNSFGNIVEWYDFSLYAYFSTVLAKQFFPFYKSVTALLVTLLVFAVSLMARPLGACLFGYWGDRRSRWQALRGSIYMINITTFLMGLLPSYQQIGILAPIGLITLRIIQGLSVGGQYSGSISLLMEENNIKHRALACSIAYIMSTFGYIVAILVSIIVLQLTPSGIHGTYAWRIPFLLSIFFFIINKKYFLEDKKTSMIKEINHGQLLPFKLLMREHFKSFMFSCVLSIVGSGFYYSIYIYPVIYMSHYFNYSLKKIFIIQGVCLVVSCFSIALFAKLCDKVGRKSLLLTSCWGFFILSVPAIYLIQTQNVWLAGAAILLLTTLYTMFAAPLVVTFCELFPYQVRYSGIAISYNIGVAIIGALTPMLITLIINISHQTIMYAAYIMFVAILGCLFIPFIPNTCSYKNGRK